VPSEIVGQDSEVLGKRALILLLPRKMAMAKPMYENQLRAFWIPPFLSCDLNVVRRSDRNRSVLLRLQVFSLFTLGLLFGIWEGRCKHHVRGIRALIAGDEALANALVHGAVRGAGLVRKAGEVGL
jgi:hypothetical protein